MTNQSQDGWQDPGFQMIFDDEAQVRGYKASAHRSAPTGAAFRTG